WVGGGVYRLAVLPTPPAPPPAPPRSRSIPSPGTPPPPPPRRLNPPTPTPTPRAPSRKNPPPLQVRNPHAAGIDVHSDNHVACVGPGQVRTFGAYTADLQAIADHPRQAGVTAVALESTGVYWIPLFEHLEAQGFACYLIE